MARKKAAVAPQEQMILGTPAFESLMMEDVERDNEQDKNSKKQKSGPVTWTTFAEIYALLSQIKASPTEKDVVYYAELLYKKQLHMRWRDAGLSYNQYWIDKV